MFSYFRTFATDYKFCFIETYKNVPISISECPATNVASKQQELNVNNVQFMQRRPDRIPTNTNNFDTIDGIHLPTETEGEDTNDDQYRVRPYTTPSYDFIPEVDSTPAPSLNKFGK